MIILYFYDNFIQYKEKEEINEIAFPEEALDYGKIKNISLFETYLEKLARHKKWLTLFKAKKLILVVPIHYSECDKEVLTVILQNIGFQNISFKKEEQGLNLRKNQIICNIHKKYLMVYKKDTETVLFPFYIFSGMKDTMTYILKKTSKKYQYILIGNNHKIIEYAEKNNLYYYQDFKEYIIKNIIPK